MKGNTSTQANNTCNEHGHSVMNRHTERRKLVLLISSQAHHADTTMPQSFSLAALTRSLMDTHLLDIALLTGDHRKGQNFLNEI